MARQLLVLKRSLVVLNLGDGARALSFGTGDTHLLDDLLVLWVLLCCAVLDVPDLKLVLAKSGGHRAGCSCEKSAGAFSALQLGALRSLGT